MATQPKESDYLKAWALYFVCGTLCGFVAGAIIGGVMGVIFGVAGLPLPTIKLLCSIAGFFTGLPISYLFFRLFVSRFIVAKLVAKTGVEAESVAT